MLLVLKRSPHCLNLGIGFQIGIGLSIKEAVLPVALKQIADNQRVDTFVLPLRFYSDKKEFHCIRPFPEQCLEDMNPTEREDLTITFLKCFCQRRNRNSRSNQITLFILNERKKVHISEVHIQIHIILDLALCKKRKSVKLAICLIDKFKELLTISFLENLLARLL